MELISELHQVLLFNYGLDVKNNKNTIKQVNDVWTQAKNTHPDRDQDELLEMAMYAYDAAEQMGMSTESLKMQREEWAASMGEKGHELADMADAYTWKGTNKTSYSDEHQARLDYMHPSSNMDQRRKLNAENWGKRNVSGYKTQAEREREIQEQNDRRLQREFMQTIINKNKS